MNEQQCKTCRFWDPAYVHPDVDPDSQPDHDQGYCHRYAPHANGVPAKSGRFLSVMWPLTNQEDFCGDWAPQPQRQGQQTHG